MNKYPNYFCFLRGLMAQDPGLAMPNAAPARWDRYMAYLAERPKKPNQILDVKYSSTHHFNRHWLALDEPPSLFEILRSRGIPIVHLRRQNLLQVFISGKLAEANRVWHATDDTQLKVKRMRVDPGQFLRFAAAKADEDERLQKALKAYPRLLTIEYARSFDSEGMLSREATEQLGEFIGVDGGLFKPPAFVKQTPDSLEDVIENFDEIEQAMIKTPAAWMLYAR